MSRLFAVPRIGIALSNDRLLATFPDGRRVETGEVGDLRGALADVKQSAGAPRAVVTVALLPSLVAVRRLALPPLSADERRRVLGRDADRYFVEARQPQVVGTEVLEVGPSPVPVLAAAASARLVEEIESAVETMGWTLAAIIPAQVAWAVQADGPIVVAHLPQGSEVLHVENGRVVERRWGRSGAPDPPGAQVLDDPLAIAAASAPRAHRLELCSDARHAAERRRARRVAAGLVVAAAVCLGVAAGLDYWGLTRELAVLRARRAALATEVIATMAARDSLGALTGNVTTLGTLEATSPQWSAFLTDLADFLPRDAHVLTLRGAADSVVIQGVARQAAGVFQAVQTMPRVVGVRAEAPIRREVGPNGAVREQFVLGTALRSDAVRRAP
jgi:hypothetical protein